MDYEFLDFTSDVLFRAYGRDEKELLVNAAKAMFSVICEIGSVRPVRTVEIACSGASLEELLYEWLSTLLTESEIEEMFFSEFHIDVIEERDNMLSLRGRALGEDATVEKGATLVKGVTYYQLKVEKRDGGYAATVSLDI
ncbi:MAG: archease [Methanobacteriota archaeon]|nr:MAG: archease [Euryarchaeota archaeon]